MTPHGVVVWGRCEQVLEEILPRYRDGKISLVYLDPPFRPGEAFPDLPVDAARRRWTDMIGRCLSVSAPLASDGGTICLHIDAPGAAGCEAQMRAAGLDPVRVYWEREPKTQEVDVLLVAGAAARKFLPPAVWTAAECGSRAEACDEIAALFGRGRPFPHPKPERLLGRVLSLATDPGSVVIDAFLGSATCAAVAEKTGRSWVGIESDPHTLLTYALPRIHRVRTSLADSRGEGRTPSG